MYACMYVYVVCVLHVRDCMSVMSGLLWHAMCHVSHVRLLCMFLDLCTYRIG